MTPSEAHAILRIRPPDIHVCLRLGCKKPEDLFVYDQHTQSQVGMATDIDVERFLKRLCGNCPYVLERLYLGDESAKADK